MEKVYKVKNKITGFIFELSKEVCDKLVTEEPYNFEVIDKDYVPPVRESEQTQSVASKVVVEKPQDGSGKGEKTEILEDLTVPQLKEKLDELKIEYAKSAKKADLIALLQQQDGSGKGE
nr:MAG TPA: HeH/LEM domain [Caudoviricetes sp.]